MTGDGMTAPGPVAGRPGPRRPTAGARREYLLTLLAGAVGAAVVLLASRQGWAHVVTVEPRPLPESRDAVSGQDLVPAAGALGLAALAGLAAVLATRGIARRIVGGLLAAFGVAIAASVSLPVTSAQVRSAAAGATATAGQFPCRAGARSAAGPRRAPAAPVAGLALASHVEMAAFPWRWAVLAGGLLVIGTGLLVAWRGARWPVMSSRYDQPASQKPVAAADPARRNPVAAADPAGLWESLSRGLDPTDSAAPTAGSEAVSGTSRIASGTPPAARHRGPPARHRAVTGRPGPTAQVTLNSRQLAAMGGEGVGAEASPQRPPRRRAGSGLIRRQADAGAVTAGERAAGVPALRIRPRTAYAARARAGAAWRGPVSGEKQPRYDRGARNPNRGDSETA